MSFNPTPEQLPAINGKGSLLVSAAAGSGKTSVLVERVIKKTLLDDVPTDIDRLLIVTFTNDAAAEMRTRISDRFAEEAKNNPTNSRIIRQQLLLSKAAISTIDAFCKKLVSENFEKLDLAPDLKLVTGHQLEIMKTAAMDEAIETMFMLHNREFTRLLQLLATESDMASIRTTVSSVHNYLTSIPFPEVWEKKVLQSFDKFTSPEASPWGEFLLAKALDLTAQMLNTMTDITAELRKNDFLYEKRGVLFQPELDKLIQHYNALKNRNWDECCKTADKLLPISFVGYPVRMNSKAIFDQAVKEKADIIKEQYKSYVSNIKKIFRFDSKDCTAQTAFLAPSVGLLFETVDKYTELLNRKKSESSAFDFSDIEHCALHLLAENVDGNTAYTPFAATVSESYDEVMVDEYQDVNDLQNTIFNAISNDGEKLFVVGDVKQSIYGFRNSNPENFLNMMNSYFDYDGKASPSKIILSKNFRSRPGICDEVNFVFSRSMSSGTGGITYDENHYLYPAADYFPDRNEPEVSYFFCNRSDDGFGRNKDEVEIDKAAEIIKDMMSRPCISGKDNRLRKAVFGDFTILMRNKSHFADWYNRLKRHGIPTVCEQSEDFFDFPEVAKVLSLLRVISNPSDDVSLLSAMMSPMFGFSAEEIAIIRTNHRKGSIYSALISESDENAKVECFLGEIAYYRSFAVTNSVKALINEIYDRTGYAYALLQLETGSEKHRRLMQLLELSSTCADSGYEQVHEFLHYIDLAINGKINISFNKSALGEKQAVRIMTMHKSKGLQFPVCIIANTFGQFNAKDIQFSKALFDQSLGLGLKTADYNKHTRSTTFMFEAIKQKKLDSIVAEELRLLYVSMTRAKENLILLCSVNNLDKKLLSQSAALSQCRKDEKSPLPPVLVNSCKSHGEILAYACLLNPSGKMLREKSGAEVVPEGLIRNSVNIMLSPADDVMPPEDNDATETEPAEYDEKLTAEIKRRLEYVSPYHALDGIAAKISVSALTNKSEKPADLNLRPAFMQKEKLNAAEKGTALHEFMQYADYQSAAEDLENEIEQLVAGRFITREQADSIDRTRLREFFSGSLYGRMCAATMLKREERFIIELPASQLDPDIPDEIKDEGIVVQGIADCIFIENNKLYILDYKTDRVDNPQILANRYSGQLEIYSQAFEKLYSMPVEKRLIYSFALGITIEV